MIMSASLQSRTLKTVGLVFSVCILLAVACDKRSDNGSTTFTPTDAAQLLNAYVAALSTGDSSAVKPLWSRQSLARRGFWTLHNNFYPWGSFSEWETSVQAGKYEIQNIDPRKDHCVLQVRWLPRDSVSGQPRNVKFHVIRENGHWIFINPLDVLTRGWKICSTEHIVFYYPPELEISDWLDEIRYADAECSRALREFRLQLTRRIDYYRARTDVECGELMNFGPVNGYAVIPPSPEMARAWDLWFVASSSFVNHHEIIHLLAGQAGMPDENSAITEGLACAFAGAFHTTRDFIINDARNQVLQSFQYPLKTLLTMDRRSFLMNNFIAYSEAGSFIRYLHDRYGMSKLKALCSKPLGGTEVIASLKTVYGKTIDRLEREWIEYLFDKRMPEIGTTIPSTAQPVFSMMDPKGDDKGDGDYVYPAYGNYPKGSFDLRKFEVLKDQHRAYFRIEFDTLKRPVILGSETRSEKLVVGGIIAIQKGKGGKRHLQKFCHGVRFAGDDGYDLKVNVGTNVSLTNNFGEIVFSSPEITSAISKYESNTLEFSVPLELIGEPVEEWRYFVGTCLVSNRTMNFLGEPMPVYKKPPAPIFVGGGKYDHGNPSYMDILLPPLADQARLLAAYSADAGSVAIVPMVGGQDARVKD
jgi:hypothetical protein